MSIPVAGITTSHKPKTVATLISVRRSTPLTPMAIAHLRAEVTTCQAC
jgi:hypothetical protein